MRIFQDAADHDSMMSQSPTPQLINAPAISEPFYILSTTEVRNAELLIASRSFNTRDGVVVGEAGDIAISGYGGEQWPIKRGIFLGSYLILGKVGNYMAAQRLIHVRRAWAIACDGASFSYGSRGTVPAPRGGWLYQSDATDFGFVHPDVKLAGHTEVGLQSELHRRNWSRIVEVADNFLAFAPPVLSLMALLAFFSQVVLKDEFLARLFISSETILLLLSAELVYRMRRGRWLLKAVVESGQTICRAFQDAVLLLGETPSDKFPAMSLCRAAQLRVLSDDVNPAPLPDSPATEKSLHRHIAVTLEELRKEMRGAVVERYAGIATLSVFGIIVAINSTLLAGIHYSMLEVTAIWLPSVIGTAHTFILRHRVAERLQAARELAKVLGFVQTRLYEDPASTNRVHKEANLRLLCSAIAQYSQRELARVLSSEPSIPV